MQYYEECPYKSTGDMVVTVTAAAKLDLQGKAAVIHNVGPDVLYFSHNVVTTDSPELAVGEKTFPRTGTLNVLSAGTSKLKIEFIEG